MLSTGGEYLSAPADQYDPGCSLEHEETPSVIVKNQKVSLQSIPSRSCRANPRAPASQLVPVTSMHETRERLPSWPSHIFCFTYAAFSLLYSELHRYGSERSSPHSPHRRSVIRSCSVRHFAYVDEKNFPTPPLSPSSSSPLATGTSQYHKRQVPSGAILPSAGVVLPRVVSKLGSKFGS